MTKLIISAILVIVTMLFFVTYEGINLLYYEETTADHYSYYLGIPILLYFFIGLFIEKLKYSLKDNRKWDAFQYAFSGIIGLALLYFIMVVPVISGIIITTNDLFAGGKTIFVKGTVSNIVTISTSKGFEGELTIKTIEGEKILDTNGIEIAKYKIGDEFKEQVIIGCWGLWTRKRGTVWW